MAKKYDATSKQLLEAHPRDWLALAGLPVSGTVQVVDAELSTFTLASDKLIRVGPPDPYIAHLEAQSGPDERLDERVLTYNVLGRYRHRLPVRSVVFALRRDAVRNVRGRVVDVADPVHRLEFSYHLIRVWEQPVSSILAGGLGTLPLAPISAVEQEQVPEVLRSMRDRLAREVAPAEARELMTAAIILSGLRYPGTVLREWMRGVTQMKESSAYQLILEEGRAEEAKRMLLRIGKKRFGPPDARIQAAIESIEDTDRLESLAERVSDVNNWQELLG